MNKTLNEIILDWIGGDNLPLLEPIAIHESGQLVGRVKALSDLRARVPELVEKIENLKDEFITVDLFMKLINIVEHNHVELRKAINSLTSE